MAVHVTSMEDKAGGPRQWDLLERCRRGDREAIDVLVEEHYDRTYRIAFRILGCREAAEDAVQEVFLLAWRNLKRYKGKALFSTWLHTITVNHCLSQRRKKGPERERRQPATDEFLQTLGTPGGAFPARWEEEWAVRIALYDALSKLSKDLREVVTLYFFADYTVQEAAVALGWSLSTTHRRLRQGIERLQRLMCPRDSGR